MLSKEKFKELWYDDRLKTVVDDIDDSWRHGNYHYTVFQMLDENDNPLEEYYEVSYRVSGDGEYHGIREGEYEITEVEKYTEMVEVTKFRKKE